MVLFDAPSSCLGAPPDAIPQKTAAPLSDPDLVGRVLDYSDDEALATAASVSKPFARAAAYSQKKRLLRYVPSGLRTEAARALRPERCAAARRRARSGRFARTDLGGFRPSKRFGHSAVAYDGGLWVFGGRDGKRYEQDVWRFDVATAAWRLVDGPAADRDRFAGEEVGQGRAPVARPAPRRAHTATLHGNCMLVIGGGDAKGALGDVWSLALNDAPRWMKRCDAFASTSSDREWKAFGHSAAKLDGGGACGHSRRARDVLVLFGGASNAGQAFRATNDVELLELSEQGARTLVHSAEGQPPPAVYRHSCTPLGGDRFLVAGGYTFAPTISSEELENGRGISLTYCTNRVYELHVRRGIVRWAELTVTGTMLPPLGGHAACLVARGTVFLCGGGDQTAWLPEDVDRPRESDSDTCYLLKKLGRKWGRAAERTRSEWRCVAAPCSLPHPCGGHTATIASVATNDLGIVILGGRDYQDGGNAGRDDMTVFSFLGDVADGVAGLYLLV